MSSYKAFVVFFVAVFHTMALGQFLLHAEAFAVPQRFTAQVAVMIAVSLLMSICSLFLRRSRVIVVCFSLARLALIFIIGYPLGNYVGVELTLLMSLVVEIGIHFELRASIPMSLAFIGAMLAAQTTKSAWGREVSRVQLENLLALAFYPMISIFAGNMMRYFGRILGERNQLIESLQKASMQLVDTNVELQEHIATKEEQVILLERKRISREIHDIIGHYLMNIVLMMKASAELSDEKNTQLRSFLANTQNLAQEGLTEIRRALRILRTPTKKKLPLVTMINRLVNAFDNTHILIKVDYRNIPRSFSEEIDRVLNRIVQEGITNAIKHGNADRIDISFWLDEGQMIQLAVEDNGTGCDALTEGIGLKGMKERVAGAGGWVECRNTRNGFLLLAGIPTRREADSHGTDQNRDSG